MFHLFTDKLTRRDGFTIVELLIVIVVIAILAAITIVSYNGITRRATEAALQTNLTTARTKLELDRARDGSYTTDGHTLASGSNTKLEYTIDPTEYCLTASSEATNLDYYIDSASGMIKEGVCEGHTGSGGTSGATLEIITTALTNASIDTPYDFTIQTSAESNFTVTAGTLPPGLSLNAQTGQVTGVPTEQGSFNVTVTAQSEQGSASRSFTLVVGLPSCPPTVMPRFTYTFIGTTQTQLTMEWRGCSPTTPPTIPVYYKKASDTSMKFLGNFMGGATATALIKESDFCDGLDLTTVYAGVSTTYHYIKPGC